MRRLSFARPLVLAVVVVTAAACNRPRPETAPATSTPSSRIVTDTARGEIDANTPLVELDIGATHAIGIYLTDVAGRALYAIGGRDPASPAGCNAECRTQFEPVTGRGSAAVGQAAVIESMIGTVEGPDGVPHVTYNGKPLYRFKGDRWITDTNGHGRRIGGATAWLVHPNGDLMTASR